MAFYNVFLRKVTLTKLVTVVFSSLESDRQRTGIYSTSRHEFNGILLPITHNNDVESKPKSLAMLDGDA